MLQAHKHIADPWSQGKLEEPAADSPKYFFTMVRRRAWLIASATTLATLLGILYVSMSAPSYIATVEMLVDPQTADSFQQKENATYNSDTVTAIVDSQVQLLKSEDIARAVVDQEQLTQDPEFVGENGSNPLAAISRIAQIFGFNGPSSNIELTRRAVRALQSRMTVQKAGQSYVIDIGIRSGDRVKAAKIANAVADEFVLGQLNANFKATRRASEWLEGRLTELRNQATAAEQALVTYRTQHHIVAAEGTLIDEQQLGEVNSQLVNSAAQTSDALAKLNQIEAVLNANSPNAAVDGTVADTLKDEVITKLRSKYLDIQSQELEWAQHYGQNHEAAARLREQMQDIRLAITEELRRIAEGYKSDYAIAKQRQDTLQAYLENAVSQSQVTNQALITEMQLENNAKSYRTLYTDFLKKYMESLQQQSFPMASARVVFPALPPLDKSNIRGIIVVLMSALAGAAFGLGIGIARDMLDRVFRTSAQVETELRTQCIATIPRVKVSISQTREIGSVSADERIIRRRFGEPLWSSLDQPFSQFAESLRAVKLSLDLNEKAVIGFTSSLPSEGKSTLSSALAGLLASGGHRTVLVDCDLRNSVTSAAYASSADRGLIDILAGEANVEDVIWRDPITGLQFIPTVPKGGLHNSSDFLSSRRIRDLFECLRADFEYVIVDFPPILPIVDVRGTKQLVDGYILVVEWGNTPVAVAKRALNEAGDAIRDNLIGAVLNKVNVASLAKYEGNAAYAYGKHLAKYKVR
jgi:polysaccharide biosynthesis transport protein